MRAHTHTLIQIPPPQAVLCFNTYQNFIHWLESICKFSNQGCKTLFTKKASFSGWNKLHIHNYRQKLQQSNESPRTHSVPLINIIIYTTFQDKPPPPPKKKKKHTHTHTQNNNTHAKQQQQLYECKSTMAFVLLLFFFECCFTSTETTRTIKDREPRSSTSTFTQPLSSVCYPCCESSQRLRWQPSY